MSIYILICLVNSAPWSGISRIGDTIVQVLNNMHNPTNITDKSKKIYKA